MRKLKSKTTIFLFILIHFYIILWYEVKEEEENVVNFGAKNRKIRLAADYMTLIKNSLREFHLSKLIHVLDRRDVFRRAKVAIPVPMYLLFNDGSWIHFHFQELTVPRIGTKKQPITLSMIGNYTNERNNFGIRLKYYFDWTL